MESKIFQIDAFWDAESSVWVATSDDVPGLATEADSFEALQEKLRGIVPELLMLNRVIAEDYRGSISFELTSHKQQTVELEYSWRSHFGNVDCSYQSLRRRSRSHLN